ncbi:ATP-dependent nuclease [Oceanobacter antarcticus]|uniref:AAA family ATPase n=1 Tax=Oceanobacter antarcticus TaxID=3133425 RepID=A0ABW8NHZ4_9GAMM|tara:strand:+ start:70 stop:1755 length:1686 start_codon:yes stop_codon:yes gene_type:complete
MKIEGLRIRNFRTIGSEQHIDLTRGLTIVGPNSSGKTNILKSIEMLFTGLDNKLGYDVKRDLTFSVSNGQTSLVATFSGDEDGDDKDFFQLYRELNKMLEDPKPVGKSFSLYLNFAKSGTPMYRFFSNEKMKSGQSGPVSHKQKAALNCLLDKFVCHYVPSSKSISDLYSSLLLPFIKRSVSRVLDDKLVDINRNLTGISKTLDDQLSMAGLPHIKSHFSLPNNSMEELIDRFEFHLSDPNKTEIDRKGMGIQASAILASFLWITKEEAKLSKNTIWLIEEPESYLHPELAGSCHRMLEQLRSEALLVTTTHSLGFVNQDPRKVVGTAIDNENTKVIQYESYVEATSSIRSALGVRFSDYYNLGVLNVFVEGKSDREIFQWALKKITPKEDGTCEWKYLRSADFLDFTGVSGMEGFMKATYEFIQKERPVVTVLDGDPAGDKTRRDLQHYLGNKNISFEANRNFISLHTGFSLEGLFPHEWIIGAHAEHPNWFKDYSVDVEGKLQPFDLKSNQTKTQLRAFLVNKSESDDDNLWVDKFEQVFNMLEMSLHSQYVKVYGSEM